MEKQRFTEILPLVGQCNRRVCASAHGQFRNYNYKTKTPSADAVEEVIGEMLAKNPRLDITTKDIIRMASDGEFERVTLESR